MVTIQQIRRSQQKLSTAMKKFKNVQDGLKKAINYEKEVRREYNNLVKEYMEQR